MAGVEDLSALIDQAVQATSSVQQTLGGGQSAAGGSAMLDIAGLVSEGVQAAGVLRDWFDPSAGVQVQSHTFAVRAGSGDADRPLAPGERGRRGGRDPEQLHGRPPAAEGEIPISADEPIVRTEREAIAEREGPFGGRRNTQVPVLTVRSREFGEAEVVLGLQTHRVEARVVCVAGVLSLKRGFDTLIGSQVAVQFDGVDLVNKTEEIIHALSFSGWFKRPGLGYFVRFLGLVIVRAAPGADRVTLEQGGMRVTGATRTADVSFGAGYKIEF